MKKELTERQQEILNFIRATTASRGMPPSMREIGKHFKIRSTNGVAGHLAALERSGHITRHPGKSRGVTTQAGTSRAAAVPLLGQVAAGFPVLSPENREGEVTVDLSQFSLRSSQNLFAVKVKGDSMIEAHILEGDTLLVRSQSTAHNGDIVVAMVDGETTVKRFFAEVGRFRLQPENSDMEPIYLERGDFRILGKAVGVMRKM